MILIFFICLISSALISIILAQSSHLGIDYQSKIQKIHDIKSVRLGGISIFLSLFFGIAITNIEIFFNNFITFFLFFLILLVGVVEDLTSRVNANKRLVLLSIISFFFVYFNETNINLIRFNNEEVFQLGAVLTVTVSLFLFVCTVNAFNIIDGINGLSSGHAMTIFYALLLNNYVHNTDIMNQFLFIALGSTFGFWIVNIITGRIFLGDGGSYLLGALCLYSGIQYYKLNENTGFLLLAIIFIYPACELTSTCLYRLLDKTNLLHPDDKHLHSILFRKLKNTLNYNNTIINSLSGLLLNLLNLVVVSFSIIFYDETIILLLCSLMILMFLLIKLKYRNYK